MSYADEHVLRHRSCEFTFSRGNSILFPFSGRRLFGRAKKQQNKTRQKSCGTWLHVRSWGDVDYRTLRDLCSTLPPPRCGVSDVRASWQWCCQCCGRLMKPFLVPALAPSRCSPAQGYCRDAPCDAGLLFIPQHLCLSSLLYRRWRTIQNDYTLTNQNKNVLADLQFSWKAKVCLYPTPTKPHLWSQAITTYNLSPNITSGKRKKWDEN